MRTESFRPLLSMFNSGAGPGLGGIACKVQGSGFGAQVLRFRGFAFKVSLEFGV